MHTSHRHHSSLSRRVRRWWRETPTSEAAQTFIGLGLVLLVVAALIAFATGH